MIHPIGKKILVKPIEQKHGTLVITNQKPTQFYVISVGDEVMKVIAGNIIYMEKHYGIEIEYENEKFLVIDESSILAKLD